MPFISTVETDSKEMFCLFGMMDHVAVVSIPPQGIFVGRPLGIQVIRLTSIGLLIGVDLGGLGPNDAFAISLVVLFILVLPFVESRFMVAS